MPISFLSFPVLCFFVSFFMSSKTGLVFHFYQLLIYIYFFATPWTVAHEPPLSMEFPRQEYWSRLPFPPPRELPHPKIEPTPLASLQWQVDSSPLHRLESPSVSFPLPYMLLFFLSFFFKLEANNIVLVLPYINMNLPRVCKCSPS